LLRFASLASSVSSLKDPISFLLRETVSKFLVKISKLILKFTFMFTLHNILRSDNFRCSQLAGLYKGTRSVSRIHFSAETRPCLLIINQSALLKTILLPERDFSSYLHLYILLEKFFLQISLCNDRSALRSALTHLLSAFLCRCSFRYHSSRLFLGRKRETASARSCHPWISTYCAGLVLQSKIVEVEWPCVSGGLWEVEAVDCASAFSPLPFAAGLCVSQVKSDCVAQRRSCCNGMLAYYYVPAYILSQS